jgi:hypothetical protein
VQHALRLQAAAQVILQAAQAGDLYAVELAPRVRLMTSAAKAHARRKFHELWVNHSSQVEGDVLVLFNALYDVEREAANLDAVERWSIRQARAKPIADKLQAWLIAHRQKVPEGSATAKAIDYSLKRLVALTRDLDDGALPVDNNWVENRIRPLALGRSNWLFAGSLRGGKRAAAIMSLIESVKLNGREPLAYLTDVLQRLPTHPASRIDDCCRIAGNLLTWNSERELFAWTSFQPAWRGRCMRAVACHIAGLHSRR